MDSARMFTRVELTGSGSVAIDDSRAAVMAAMVSGENATFEKSFIVDPTAADGSQLRLQLVNESYKIPLCSWFRNVFHDPAL
jgi:hypothetical protein